MHRGVTWFAGTTLVLTAAVLFSVLAGGDTHPGDYQSDERSITSGTELLGVFLVSSGCQASNTSEFAAVAEEAQARLSAEADRRGVASAIIGVSLDPSPAMGLAFLQSLGEFDEVVAGRGWVNSAATVYLVRDLRGRLATPQLVVLQREVTVDGSVLAIGQDQFLGRYIGIDEIATAFSEGDPF